MINFSNVSKRYPNSYDALKNITFTIETGEMVFITGHSGAGKSTLLKLIAAIERPTSGSIIVNGQNIGTLKGAAISILRRNLGLVFQDQKILFDRSVFDNVLLPLQVSGFDPKAATGRVRVTGTVFNVRTDVSGRLEVTVLARKGPVWKMHGEALVDGAVAAKADVTATIPDGVEAPAEGAGQ